MKIYEDVYFQIMYIPRAIVLTCCLSFAYMFIKDNDLRQVKMKLADFIRHPWELLFVFYFLFIITSTLIARWAVNPYGNVLNDFGLITENGWNHECVENIVLFVPYTFLYLKAKMVSVPWKSALIFSLCTTMFIEFSQLLFWLGQFQISDMFYNTIGGMIGCGIWFIFRMNKLREKHE